MKILAINPGSTSTKVALFKDHVLAADLELSHPKEELAAFARVGDQMDYRGQAIRRELSRAGADLSGLSAVVGRGGLLAPLPGGVYAIDDDLIDDLVSARHGEHPCNLGAPLALQFAREAGCPAFIVDPPVTDEMEEVAKITGFPEIRRRSVFHALSQRGAARKAARGLGVRYSESGFIVAHLGGGISIGAHRKGRVVDVINALDGEGPFSPERAGRIPLLPLLDLLNKGRVPMADLRAKVLTRGGLYAHLGTNDLRQALARADAGDEHAALIFRALAYNIAKEISSLLPVFADGNGGMALSAVVLTGGMARSERLVEAVRAGIAFGAPVVAVTGLEEMEVLAEGAALALSGEVPVNAYQGDGE